MYFFLMIMKTKNTKISGIWSKLMLFPAGLHILDDPSARSDVAGAAAPWVTLPSTGHGDGLTKIRTKRKTRPFISLPVCGKIFWLDY